MSAEKTYLERVYDLFGSIKTDRLYDEWAQSYDAELRRNGYITPARCAQALAALVTDKAAPVLDIGCGTGLSGAALAAAGFTAVDGVDYSEEMLSRARAKGLYRALARADLAAPLALGRYANAMAAGVMHPGHAPPEGFDHVLALLPAGGLFVFSLNDHALEEGAHLARVKALAASGAAEIAFEEYGDHLPGQNLKATVYALRKLA